MNGINNYDYKTAKKIYEKELLKENGIVVEVSERNHLIDKYKSLIDYKLETIPTITASAILSRLTTLRCSLSRYLPNVSCIIFAYLE